MIMCSFAQRSAACPHYCRYIIYNYAVVRPLKRLCDSHQATACSLPRQLQQYLHNSRHLRVLPAAVDDGADITGAAGCIDAQPSRRRSRRRTATASGSMSERVETVQQKRRQVHQPHEEVQPPADKQQPSRRRTRRTSRATSSRDAQDTTDSLQQPRGGRKLGLGVLLLQQARQSAAVPLQQPAGPALWSATTAQQQAPPFVSHLSPFWLLHQAPPHGAQPQWQHSSRWHTANSVATPQVGSSAVPYSALPASAPSTPGTMRTSHKPMQSNDQDDLDWQQQQDSRLLQLVELLADRGIELPELRGGQQRTQCPECNNGSQNEDCFAVKVDPDIGSAVWQCHRASCGFKGGVKLHQHSSQHHGEAYRDPVTGRRSHSISSSNNSVTGSGWLQDKISTAALPYPNQLLPLDNNLLQWFKERGISQATLLRNRVAMQMRYCRALGGAVVPQIAFPFYQNGVMVNVKYRALPKHFCQVKNGQQVFYGLDDVKGASHVIIVEGEMDKLAIEEATGVTAVLSIPSGAAPYTPQQLQDLLQSQQEPMKPQRQHTHNISSNSTLSLDRKFAYVHRAADLLRTVEQITIAVDGDAAGFFTACELARRLGPDRCMYLPWPAAVLWGKDALQHVAHIAQQQFGVVVDTAAGSGCKDANDMLMVYGGQFLKLYLENAATPFTNVLQHVQGKAVGVNSTQQHMSQAVPVSTSVPAW